MRKSTCKTKKLKKLLPLFASSAAIFAAPILATSCTSDISKIHSMSIEGSTDEITLAYGETFTSDYTCVYMTEDGKKVDTPTSWYITNSDLPESVTVSIDLTSDGVAVLKIDAKNYYADVQPGKYSFTINAKCDARNSFERILPMTVSLQADARPVSGKIVPLDEAHEPVQMMAAKVGATTQYVCKAICYNKAGQEIKDLPAGTEIVIDTRIQRIEEIPSLPETVQIQIGTSTQQPDTGNINIIVPADISPYFPYHFNVFFTVTVPGNEPQTFTTELPLEIAE